MQDSNQLKQDSAKPAEEAKCDCPVIADRKFEKPVSWLLGRQLIASLKSTLLYTAFGSKIDARDWMDAKVFPYAPREPQKNNNAGDVVEPPFEVTDAWKKMYARDNSPAVDFTTEKGEFWFDYISDTGDGMTATYSIAYLCLSDLWIKKVGDKVPKPEPKAKQQDEKGEINGADEEVDQRLLVRMKSKKTDNLDGLLMLPRGEFLLVGGDTSYHMADYASLHIRFQKPFQWAYEDLRKDLGAPAFKDLSEAEKQKEIARYRPLFGIPGNHDYYDMLDGFRRQFREPTRSRSENNYYSDDYQASQLRIPGFRRYQETSYIALRLPFDWMIWGLDTEVGKLDERQRDFFQLVKERCAPQKLIVCTSAPHTVFGKFANKDDEKSAKAFLQLGLPRPFLRSENPEVPQVDYEKGKQPKPEVQMKDTDIRLDLAGDVHHYARYWGPASEGTQPTRKSAKAPALARSNYASVMSGLGGAFHHPSTTYVDEIKEQALYPKEAESRKHVAGEIFNPWRVVKGGGVWFVGGLVALILAFAAIADDSTRPAIHNFLLFRSIGLTQRERYEPTVLSVEEAKKKQSEFKPSVVSNLLGVFGVASEPWEAKPFESGCDTTLPVYLWGRCRTEWPTEYIWGFWLLVLTVPVMLVAMLLMRRHYRIWKEREEVDEKARQAQQATIPPSKFDNEKHKKSVNWTIWGFTVGTTLLALIGVLIVMPYRNFITPFGNSLLVLLSMCWAAMAIYLSIKYSDWLFEQASQRQIRRRDWAITWVLTACAFFAVAIGLWVFGKNNPAAYLVADIVSVLVVIAIPILLLVAAWKIGGAHQKFLGKIGMGVIGFWHAILQIGVAVFLIKKGTWLTVLLSIVLVLIFWMVGKQLMSNNKRVLLTFAWVLFGALMLALPPLTYYFLIEYRHALPPEFFAASFFPHSVEPVLDPVNPLVPFSQYEWWSEWKGWWQLFPIFLAGVFGAFLSCVWLGWYFGVCLGFNGHNNETGGAARIEKFKQMIRFRLTPETLTGYVIAVRDPQRCGKCLNPQIVDIFHLTREKP